MLSSLRSGLPRSRFSFPLLLNGLICHVLPRLVPLSKRRLPLWFELSDCNRTRDRGASRGVVTKFPGPQPQPDRKMTFLKYVVITICLTLDLFYLIGRMISAAQEVEK